jgi:G:T-mismatch repair DNA endonuclease (very short patch repair protein)
MKPWLRQPGFWIQNQITSFILPAIYVGSINHFWRDKMEQNQKEPKTVISAYQQDGITIVKIYDQDTLKKFMTSRWEDEFLKDKEEK